MFEALKEYKKKHGDCDVPHTWSENKQLYSWVATQRTNYRNEKLSEDRIKRLEEIGFEWTSHLKKRDEEMRRKELNGKRWKEMERDGKRGLGH